MNARITPELLLHAYAAGVFPMSEGADDPGLFWVDPEMRGIIPLESFHIPRRLARTVRGEPFEIRIDSAFDAVIDACASPRETQPDTWINRRIRELYGALFRMGHVHTVECWSEGRLVGGLYGVSLGRAFFGESMFHRATDASKVALVHLVARLRAGGYRLLDTQFQTEHLAQFGTLEVPRERYRAMLAEALRDGTGDWWQDGRVLSGADAVRLAASPGLPHG